MPFHQRVPSPSTALIKKLTLPNIFFFIKLITGDGTIEVLEGNEVPLIMYGSGFTKDTKVVFTSSGGKSGEECKFDTG